MLHNVNEKTSWSGLVPRAVADKDSLACKKNAELLIYLFTPKFKKYILPTIQRETYQ